MLYSIEIQSRVTLKSKEFTFPEICVGNTFEMVWQRAGTSVCTCISINNTIFKQIKVTRFECDVILTVYINVTKSMIKRNMEP